MEKQRKWLKNKNRNRKKDNNHHPTKYIRYTYKEYNTIQNKAKETCKNSRKTIKSVYFDWLDLILILITIGIHSKVIIPYRIIVRSTKR